MFLWLSKARSATRQKLSLHAALVGRSRIYFGNQAGLTCRRSTLPKIASKNFWTKEFRLHCKRTPYLQSRNLRFEASDGRVTLHGRVGTWYQKQMAQESLLRLDGVDAVHNQLEVC